MSDTGYLGTMDLGDLSHPYNLDAFTILQHIGKMATVELVQVIAVHGGGVNPTGTVDVQPMVNQIDGKGNPVAHGTIYNIPYFRIQGGTRAVINDPVVGDIGLCAFSSRDISKVKTTLAIANPGSRRRFDWADGLYFGSFLGGVPDSYVMLSAAGITIADPTQVSISSPSPYVTDQDGNVVTDQSGNPVTTPVVQFTLTQSGITIDLNGSTMTITNGDVIADGISLKTHTHPDVQSGSSNTGEPNP